MLKQELNAALKVRTAGNLGKLEIRPIPAEARRHAAVALVILDQRGDAAFANIPFLPLHASQAAFILAIRSEGLKDHGGQRAFPGGRIDAGETPEEAALLGKATRVAQFDQPRFAWSWIRGMGSVVIGLLSFQAGSTSAQQVCDKLGK